MSQLTLFEKVRFRNFQSFGNNWTEIDLTLRGTTHVVGENLDEGGSSGAGKTTALAVVSYCLYDKIPSGVSKDKMVNSTNGKKNTSMEAEFHFSKGSNKYIIHRSRGQTTGVHLYENGKDVTPASVVEVNAKIEELVGFSYNLFSMIILFSGNSRPFLDLSVGEQRALIEELFKITMLTQKANVLKKQHSETNKQIDLLKVLIGQQEAQNDGYRKRLADAETRANSWDSSQALEIKNNEALLDAIKNIDFDTEEQLHARVEEITRLVTESHAVVRQLATERAAKAKEIHPKTTEYNRKISEVEKLKKEADKIARDLKHLAESKCPYCLQDYADAAKKIDSLKEQQSKIVEEIRALVEETESIEFEMSSFSVEKTRQLDDLDKQISELRSSADKLQNEAVELKSVLSYGSYKDHVNAKAGITALEDTIAKMKLETNPHLDALDQLRAEGEIAIDYDSLNALVTLSEHQKFLVKLLTDKNSYIRKNLIATTTPFLNKRIGYYLERLNLPHVVLFQPDMSCEITQLGRSLDHGNLSNGEKKRLNLALCLSFRDVLTYHHAKVNVLFTDEVDGGSLDSNCVDLLISLLKKKAWDDDISIFIISHRPEFEGRCDRTFVVRKEQGFSNLIVQPDG